MSHWDRRNFLFQGLATGLALGSVRAFAQTKSSECPFAISAIQIESNETPFFEHYHSLRIPVEALIHPPTQGMTLNTSLMDLDSYNAKQFQKFAEQSGLNPQVLRRHSHEVHLSKEQLVRIAMGEKDVEVRVISANKNYVHNFLITASPAILATVRKAEAKAKNKSL